jgi:hypothetical protein
MAKTDNRPKEKMRLVIEFADNGIILRTPELEDEVTLALTKKSEYACSRYDFVHDDEYNIIGKKIYDWLVEVIVPEYSGTLVITGAELDITATLTGREHKNKNE